MRRNSSPSWLVSSRRSFLKTAAAGGAAAALVPLYPAMGAARATPSASSSPPDPAMKRFELDEITIAELQDSMKSGRFTARSLVEKYTARIDEIDKQGPAINSILE